MKPHYLLPCVLLAACQEYGVAGGIRAEDVAPAIEASPSVLAFGDLQPGQVQAQSFTVTNRGNAILDVEDVLVGGSASFRLLTAVPDLLPGESAQVDVEFTPLDPANAGFIEIASNDPATPRARVELYGGGLLPDLVITPSTHDFGDVWPGCRRSQPFRVENIGLAPITIERVAQTGAGYTLDRGLQSAPLTLEPGDTWTLEVEFASEALGEFAGALHLATDDAAGVHVAHQSARAVEAPTLTDRWTQAEYGSDQTDIIFWVDGSGSMGDDEELVAQNFEVFTDRLTEIRGDWRILVTSRSSGCPVTDYLTPDTADKSAAFTEALTRTDAVEAGLTALRNALAEAGDGGCNEGFLREDASKVGILVSDEVEQSSKTWGAMVGEIRTYAPGAVINAVAGPVPSGCSTAEAGTGYFEAATDTGGQFLSICEADWASHLEALAETVGRVATNKFYLSEEPVPSTIVVRVDGEERADWRYDDKDNVVVFDEATMPAPGAEIEITYGYVDDCG